MRIALVILLMSGSLNVRAAESQDERPGLGQVHAFFEGCERLLDKISYVSISDAWFRAFDAAVTGVSHVVAIVRGKEVEFAANHNWRMIHPELSPLDRSEWRTNHALKWDLFDLGPVDLIRSIRKYSDGNNFIPEYLSKECRLFTEVDSTPRTFPAGTLILLDDENNLVVGHFRLP